MSARSRSLRRLALAILARPQCVLLRWSRSLSFVEHVGTQSFEVKMSITNLRISRKLALGFACVLLVVAIMSGTLFVALQLANAAAKLNGVATTILDKLDQGAAALFDAA